MSGLAGQQRFHRRHERFGVADVGGDRGSVEGDAGVVVGRVAAAEQVVVGLPQRLRKDTRLHQVLVQGGPQAGVLDELAAWVVFRQS